MTVEQFRQALDNFLSECQRIMGSEAREESRLTTNCLNRSPELSYLLDQKDTWNSRLSDGSHELTAVLSEVRSYLQDVSNTLSRYQASDDTLALREVLLHGRENFSGCDNLKLEADRIIQQQGPQPPRPLFDDVS